jgi:hypothetical protein
MKSLLFDPQVKQIIDASRLNLEQLQKERDLEIKQFEVDQIKVKEDMVA